MGKTPASDPIVELVADCLARIDESGDAPTEVIEAFCREHPEHAEALRERLGHLERAGLAIGRSPLPLEDGRTLGRFRILGELGRGGMGVVYLALDPRLGRRVALKALGPRLVISDRARTRFEREIRAIAGLKHPRIVPVYEVGEEAGIPWYTMELIEGRTLAQVVQSLKDLQLRTDELNPTHLSQVTFFEREDTDSRLLHDSESGAALAGGETPSPEIGVLPTQWGKTYVETVCRMVHDVAEALDHAHAQGVVHRDVKPSNVLIDARGHALLFDFGLARLESEEALTQTGDFAGTPFYVAPEQIAGGHGRGRTVDHRDDVYSLGVTLFELLTLQRPFQGKNTQQVFRQILTKDPPLPRRLNRLVPRDLETICLTALEKDPERRYRTAGELAADMRRFLEFRPVRARPIGWPTRTLRWSRRNPGAAVAAGLALVIAVGVPAGVFATGVSLAREAERTATEAQKSARINRFLLEMLGAANPAELAYDATISEAVDLAAERVDLGLDEPEVEAGVRATIGNTYLAVGRLADAERNLRRALDLRIEALGPDHADVARTRGELGLCRLHQGDHAEAEELLNQALAFFRAGGPTEELTRALSHLALLRSTGGDFDAARGLLAESLDLCRAVFGGESPEVAAGLVSLGSVLERQGRTGGQAALLEAEHNYRGALSMLERLRGGKHPDTASCRSRLAELLIERGELQEAEDLLVRTWTSYEERLGPRHALVARTKATLARLYHLDGRNADARDLAGRALDMQEAVLPASHPDIASSKIILARILMELKIPEDASRLLEAAVTIRRRGTVPELTADALHQLARSYYQQVRLEEALSTGEEALRIYRGLPVPDPQMIGGLRHVLGLASVGMGRRAEALDHLADAAASYAERRGPDAPATIIYRNDLALVLYLEGRWEEAEAMYREVLASRRRLGTYGDHETVSALNHVSECLVQRGDYEGAVATAREALELDVRLRPKPSMRSAACQLRIGRVLFEGGRFDEAVEPLSAGVEIGLEAGGIERRLLLDSARLVGQALGETGELDLSEQRLLTTLAAQEAYLGIQHPDVRLTLENLRALYARLGRGDGESYVRGRLALSLSLRDAGVPPYVGELDDRPLAYGSSD